MKKYLMCRPTFYGIQYEINPWMNIRKPILPTLAEKQWAELYHTLTDVLKAEVKLIEPKEGLPDMVFTANAGLVFDNKIILSNFRYKQRQGEARFFEAWFKDAGYQLFKLPSDVAFEGAGDALFCGENLFAGYIFRSEARCHSLLSDIVGKRVLSLELTDPRFYHLDTCFCPLEENSAVYYPGAFDRYANQVIENYLSDPIAVPKEEALKFACNAVAMGKSIILGSHCPQLREALSQRDYQVIELDLAEFMKSGGSAKCLTLELR